MARLSKQILLALIIQTIGSPALASPMAELVSRTENQPRDLPYKLPDDIIFLDEWFPHGCGNGGSAQGTVYGYQDTLGKCLQAGGVRDGPGDDAAVRISWRPTGQKWRWQIFSGNNCSEEIAHGTEEGCHTIPKDQTVGAIIVYAE